MFFDYCISNPPYQRDDQSSTASRRTTTDIFPNFQKTANYISHNTVMIYPATWQKNVNIGLGKFLKNNGLSSSIYYDGSLVFPSIVAGFPLSVVITHNDYDGNIFINYVEQERDLNVWLDHPAKKVLYDHTKDYKKLGGSIDPTKLSNIKDSGLNFYEDPMKLNNSVKMYIKKNPGVQSDGGTYFIERDSIVPFVKDLTLLDCYTVSIPSSPMGRMRFFNELLFKKKFLGAKVFAPGELHSLTYAVVKVFDDEESAENFKNYVNTHFFTMLTSLDFSKKNFASFVPDLVDYSDNNDLFKRDTVLGKDHVYYGLSLDDRLLKFFNLTNSELRIVEDF